MLRRVVTGQKGSKAQFMGDGVPPRTNISQKMPGMAFSIVWATSARPQITTDGEADAVAPGMPILPGPGETRLVYLQVPPASVALRKDFDAAGAAQEFADLQPDMAACHEADSPGMHRTETIDYVIVLDGEIYLELDDQEEKLLKPHDVVIQNGTRHAWRNRSNRPVLLAVVLIGAERTPGR